MLRQATDSTVGNLGSTNAGFTMRTGLAVPHAPYLRVEPLSRHATFPFAFRRQVGRVSLGSVALNPTPFEGESNEHRSGAHTRPYFRRARHWARAPVDSD